MYRIGDFWFRNCGVPFHFCSLFSFLPEGLPTMPGLVMASPRRLSLRSTLTYLNTSHLLLSRGSDWSTTLTSNSLRLPGRNGNGMTTAGTSGGAISQLDAEFIPPTSWLTRSVILLSLPSFTTLDFVERDAYTLRRVGFFKSLTRYFLQPRDPGGALNFFTITVKKKKMTGVDVFLSR